MRRSSQRFDPRQHMRTGDFEIFHYRDSAPGPVAIHHHDFYEVYFFLGGQVEYRVEGAVYHMEPGDLLLISPMELHQPIVKPDSEPYERMVLWIDRDYLESLSTGETSLTRCFDQSRPDHTNLLRLNAVQRAAVASKLDGLAREARGGDYGGALWAAGALLQLLVELNRAALQSGGAGTAEEPSLVSRVLDYIGEHCQENLVLEDLAQRFYVSKFYLSHAFRQEVGVSVYRYVQLKRLLIARQMLRSGTAPGVVCHSCGFGDYANFYRAFRAAYGVSPRTCQRDGEKIFHVNSPPAGSDFGE